MLAATNEEAAKLAGLVRERRVERGQIPGGREITLRDGNPASRGALVRARLNTEIDAGGQPLANRDVIRITGWQGEGPERHAIVQRQLSEPGTGGRRWSDEFTVPAAYLEENAELAYAGNVLVAQRRTVDTSHLVVSEGMTRDLLYVGMTRGRRLRDDWMQRAAVVQSYRELAGITDEAAAITRTFRVISRLLSIGIPGRGRTVHL